jgi:hypothetical protein
MGLDNMPHEYPCVLQDTVIRGTDKKIDCDATIAAGSCPWKLAGPPDGVIYGMFGTYCWYRGKVGEWMIEEVEGATGEPSPHSLFGCDREDDEQPALYPAECEELATWLADRGESYLEHRRQMDDPEQLHAHGQEYGYLVWWLKWVARTSGGIDAWW